MPCEKTGSSISPSGEVQLLQNPNKAMETRIVIRSATIVALAGALAACATAPKVHTEAKPGTDFSRYKTFALLPLPTVVSPADPGLMMRLAEPARQTVLETMQAKGLKAVELSQADFTLNLRGESLPKVEITDWGYTTYAFTMQGTVPVHVGERDVRTYDERTLIIEAFDARSKQQIWVGWSKRRSEGKVDVARVQQGIRNILAQFPAGNPLPPAEKP
jgi:hypothetical protein